jgi:UDP-2-acetamido-2,6-beta-L-arabino-hexul-4-ose reductase
VKTVLITGSGGFVGRNLLAALSRQDDVQVRGFDLADDPASLAALVTEADIIFHLAGVNRPQSVTEFATGNAGLTQTIVTLLKEQGKKTPLVLSSSTQAVLDNPYGVSKRQAEESVFGYGRETGAPVHVFRFTNIFGKWSRPDYNSVVATFCHNLAHNLPITISNPANEVELVYIDDIVATFLQILAGLHPGSTAPLSVGPTYRVTLGALAEKIGRLRDIRATLVIPDLSDEFIRKLHATYLSYLDPADFSSPLEIRTDNRGALAELIKSEQFGQMFVSRTYSGILRGDHYHDTKIEKFCVLQGEAVIRFRHLFSDAVIEYPVSGSQWQVVDIPPGYTHHIENLGEAEMIVIFWANRIFDPEQPDTYYLPVRK